ncbi:MAG: hypothetical protein NTU53_12425 [Planctomycetota bacterium]|nr:hypothetical protein [Planctomycetota bacterium]
MRRGLFSVLIVAGALFIPTVCYSAIFTTDRGEWPSTWPKGLDPYRKQAKTIRVAHGIQETVYEIRL